MDHLKILVDSIAFIIVDVKLSNLQILAKKHGRKRQIESFRAVKRQSTGHGFGIT